jgi:hypothetical protein
MISVKNGRLQDNLRAVNASWNNQQFSQVLPSGGLAAASPGSVTGTYDPKSHRFLLEWSSQIAAGPFNDFTGSGTGWNVRTGAQVTPSVHDQEGGVMQELFSFPNPVNEVSARLVAAGVVILAAATLALDQPLLLIPLAYGFVARVLTGPTLSPLGQFVTRVLTPRLPFAPKPVAGPPKRFAQGIGATLTVAALVLHFAFGFTGVAFVLTGLVVVAATLESVFAFCIGCRVFGLLMRIGVIPGEICDRCNDLRSTADRQPLPANR